MKKTIIFIILVSCLALHAISLQEMYDLAQPNGDFDKYIELETGQVYTGGLMMGSTFNPLNQEFIPNGDCSVKIVGNGAILDLQGECLSMAYSRNQFDIEDCIILNGDLRYRGMKFTDIDKRPFGTAQYITSYKPHDYGIRLLGCGENITLKNNLVYEAIDTGYDFLYTNGTSNTWLPTGTDISFSVQISTFGYPEIQDNWTYKIRDEAVIDTLDHYSLLCEYG